jgi:hypothetical protein
VNDKKFSLREKVVYHEVNHDKKYHSSFLDQYIHQLQTQIRQLEIELHDWKIRYTMETEYWRETYQSLLTEYQNHAKDSAKRIDDKFERIMFYIEETRKTTEQSMEMFSSTLPEGRKKKWLFQMVRM